jgi:hypothetical protein
VTRIIVEPTEDERQRLRMPHWEAFVVSRRGYLKMSCVYAEHDPLFDAFRRYAPPNVRIS